MEKTIDFINDINTSLHKLVGMKVKNSDEYHNAKRQILIPFLKYGLTYSTWGITTVERICIFDIHFSIKRDKRVKNGMVGEILKTELLPAIEYQEINTQLPVDKYLLHIDKINIKKAISSQEQDIINHTQSLKEKEIYNNTTIVVATPQSFWNSDVNEILEKIKIYNNNIIDWTQKEQRQYWKMLFDKLKQIDSVKNNNYSAAWLLEIILQIISKNEYHSHKIVWPKKIYYELAGLMQICKQEMQKEKKSTVKEF